MPEKKGTCPGCHGAIDSKNHKCIACGQHPMAYVGRHEERRETVVNGPTLRDQIAISAMGAILSDHDAMAELVGMSRKGKTLVVADLAELSYAYADAMINEKEKDE